MDERRWWMKGDDEWKVWWMKVIMNERANLLINNKLARKVNQKSMRERESIKGKEREKESRQPNLAFFTVVDWSVDCKSPQKSVTKTPNINTNKKIKVKPKRAPYLKIQQ